MRVWRSTTNADYEITNDTRTESGTQTVTVALKDKTNTCWTDDTDTDVTFDFEIKNANQTGITVGTADYEFGSTVSTPEKKSGTVEESATATYYYNKTDSNEGGKPWSELKADTLNPGTYYVYAVYAATTNHNAFTTPANPFKVTAKDFSASDITSEAVEKEYNGSSYGITVTSTVSGYSVKYGTSEGNCNLDESPKYKDANIGNTVYTIYYEVSARGYNTYKSSQTVKINKANAIVKADANQSKVYGTSDTSPYTFTATNLAEGEDASVLGLTLKREAGENVGSYAFVIDSYTTTNYNVTLASDSPKYEITAKDIAADMISLDSTDNSYAYTGNPITPIVTVSDGTLLTADDYTVNVTGEIAYGAYKLSVVERQTLITGDAAVATY